MAGFAVVALQGILDQHLPVAGYLVPGAVAQHQLRDARHEVEQGSGEIRRQGLKLARRVVEIGKDLPAGDGATDRAGCRSVQALGAQAAAGPASQPHRTVVDPTLCGAVFADIADVPDKGPAAPEDRLPLALQQGFVAVDPGGQGA